MNAPAKVLTPPRTTRQVSRMVRDLEKDGLYRNEIADMLRVTHIALHWWLSGQSVPTESNFARLVELHRVRGLA